MTNNVSAAMDDANEKSGSSAAAETKAGVVQMASEVEKAANKLYEENIEDEYAKGKAEPEGISRVHCGERSRNTG